jgi:hypothetical protein
MPARVQRQDAKILRNVLHCNIVRTSHYPQSRHFLDCCDELGLLILEEIPGWQHIGDAAWKDVAVDNVGRMIRRDWNRPAIIGDNPFALIGGTGAVWIRAREQAGTVRLTAKHPRLGTQTVSIGVAAAPQETV